MNADRIIVLITTPDLESAQRIASHLVERQLAACVNILPQVQSIFRWQGSVQQAHEVLLIVKTRLELLDQQVIPAVKTIHPYQVPEILALPILGGADDYLDWLDQSVQIK